MRGLQNEDKLKARVQNTLSELEQDREIKRQRNERNKEIFDAPLTIHTDFWCGGCHRDFTGTGKKGSRTNAYGVRIGWYLAKCPQGHYCYRLITDKHQDPYFSHSEAVTVQRRRFKNDTLQPSDEGFQTLYGDPLKIIDAQLEADARGEWERRRVS